MNLEQRIKVSRLRFLSGESSDSGERSDSGESYDSGGSFDSTSTVEDLKAPLAAIDNLEQRRFKGIGFDDFLRKKGIMKSSIPVTQGSDTKISSDISQIKESIERTNISNDEIDAFVERCNMYASQWRGSRTPRGVILGDLKLFADHGPYSQAYIDGKIDLLDDIFKMRGGSEEKIQEINNEIQSLKSRVASFFDKSTETDPSTPGFSKINNDTIEGLDRMNQQIDKYLNEKMGRRTPRLDAIQSLSELMQKGDSSSLDNQGGLTAHL